MLSGKRYNLLYKRLFFTEVLSLNSNRRFIVAVSFDDKPTATGIGIPGPPVLLAEIDYSIIFLAILIGNFLK